MCVRVRACVRARVCGLRDVVFISFLFHVLGQFVVSRLILHLCYYSGNEAALAASDRATLALSNRTHVQLRGRGKHLQRCLPS